MNTDGYEYLGAHLTDDGGYVFRVFAPNASSVCLVGDFCDWREGIKMRRVGCEGVWEHALERGRASVGDKYKYKILGENGWRYKTDPYAVCCEPYPADAAVLFCLDGYRWRDSGWMAFRERRAQSKERTPINIYSISADKWISVANRRVSYSTLATELAPYVKQMGYTHVLIDPAQEQAPDAKITALCAPTAVQGTPDELMSFVDSMHEAGIGVLFNVSYDCFSDREASLSSFDGQALYEKHINGPADMSKACTRALFASAVTVRAEKYHADGICIDGILTSLLGDEGEWVNSFFSELNAHIKSRYPGVITVAKLQGTQDNALTERLVSLGFDLVYLRDRARPLALTDDNRVCQVLELDRGEPFEMPELQAVIGQSMISGEATLTVMGAELGRPCEGARSERVEWELLGQPQCAMLQACVARLNQLRLREMTLSCAAKEALVCSDTDVICYRQSFCGEEAVILVNTSPNIKTGICSGLLPKAAYKEVFTSDTREADLASITDASGALRWNLSPYSTVIFKREKP